MWATVASFAVRAFLTIGISKLLNRNSSSGAQATGGGRVPVNPSTENKLPVVYGTAYMAGTVTDAKINDKQDTMWYVFAMSEVTDTGTLSYDKVYWNGNEVTFDPTIQSKVIKWTTNGGQEDTKVDGFGWIYLFTNGSSSGVNTGGQTAIQILSDLDIPVDLRWTATCTMDKTAFIIVKVKFNQNSGLTSMPTITAKMTNTLTKPGAVLLDYLHNERYGCGIPTAAIDTASFADLDTYSDQTITYYDYPYTGATHTQPRYRVNGPMITGNECMTNVNQLLDSCDSWLKFDEIISQWSVVINKAYDQSPNSQLIAALYHVTDDNLIGGIDINPTDLNSTYNAVELQYPNTAIKDATDYQYISLWETDPAILSPNEPFNQQTISLPVVNNAVQAIYLGARRLYQGREDLTVNFMLDYSGIQIEAGDVIRITSAVYGWDDITGFPDGKLFRVIQVQEAKLAEGSLGANIVASEYNAAVYIDDVIQDYVPSDNSGLADPTILGTPAAPVISDPITTTAIPSFQITTTIPSVGTFISLEYWYAVAPTGTPPSDTTTFKLWENQYFNDGPVYPRSSDQTTTISGLPASLTGYGYYFRVRACGQTTKSTFSNNSDVFVRAPNPTATIIGQNFQTSFQPSPITVGQFGNGEPDLANVVIKLYGLVGPGQVDFNATQSNANLGNSEWRIDNANIVSTGFTISTPTDGGTYAVWSAPSALTANVATMSVPIVFKDSLGNLYTAPPSVININKTVAGQDGTRGIVPLAYIPTGNVNPTTANDTTLTTFFDTSTGYSSPIDKDGAVFYASNNLASSRQYDGNAAPKWVVVTLQVPGTVITTNSISNTQLLSNTITGDKIAGNTITGNLIVGNTVTGNNIAGNTITGSHITGNTITGNLVSGNTITGDKIVGNTITGNLLAGNTVTGNNIAGTTITGDHIVGNTITGNLIFGNTITGNKIAGNTVTGNNIAGTTITGGHIVANTITGNLIFGNTITGNKIAANTITGTNITSNSITTNNLSVGNIDANTVISDLSITTKLIAANAIVGNLIALDTITADHISANAITSIKVDANAITAGKIAANAITSVTIAANAITADHISANAITSIKVDANAITAGKIAANAITSVTIAANAITTDKMAANTINGNIITVGTLYGNALIANTVNGNVIVANTLRGNTIIANTVHGNAITTNTLNGNVIVANTVYGNVMKANTLYGNAIIANTVHGNAITTNTLNGNVITANTVYGNAIIANTLHGNAITTNTLNGNVITANTINGNAITTNTLNGNVITANSLYGNVMKANTLYGNAIIANTLYGNAIIANTLHGNAITTNTLDGNVITANTVYGNVMKANTLYGNAIIANTLHGNAITTNTLNGNVITANTLYGNVIIANTVNGNVITANTLYGNAIVANSVNGNVITANTLYGNAIIANTSMVTPLQRTPSMVTL